MTDVKNSFGSQENWTPAVLNQSPEQTAMAQQISYNNTIANYYHSWERRTTQEQRAMDNENIGAAIAQLSQRPIFPLSMEITVLAYPPVDRLPDNARNLVYTVTSAFGVPLEMALGCMLAAAFIAARGKFKIRVSDRHVESLTAYLLLSAASGQRKSSVVEFFLKIFQDEEALLQSQFATKGRETARSVLRIVIRKREAELAERFADLAAQHGLEIAETMLADEFADLERLKKSNSKRLAVPRLLANISTPEKLADEMALNGEAMGIFDAEGGALRKIIGSPHMLDLYLKGYTGERFTSETKTAGSVHMTNPVLASCIVAQPKVLEAAFQNDDVVGRGLMPRFLPLFVPPRMGGWDGVPREIPADLIEWYEEHVRRLLRIRLPDSGNEERKLHILELSPEAKAEVDRYRKLVEQQIANGWFDRYAAFGNKLVGHAVRLAGAVHLLKFDDPHTHEIDDESMACGIALAEFFRLHAATAFTPEARDGVTYAPKILIWIRRHGVVHFSENLAQRAVGHAKIAQVRAGLDELARHNWVGSLITSVGRTYVVHRAACQIG